MQLSKMFKKLTLESLENQIKKKKSGSNMQMNDNACMMISKLHNAKKQQTQTG